MCAYTYTIRVPDWIETQILAQHPRKFQGATSYSLNGLYNTLDQVYEPVLYLATTTKKDKITIKAKIKLK